MNNNNNGYLRSSLVMRSWTYKGLPKTEWAFFFLLVGLDIDFCHQFVHVFRAKRSVSRIQLHCNCRDGRIPYSALSIININLVNLLSVQRSKLLYLTMFFLGNLQCTVSGTINLPVCVAVIFHRLPRLVESKNPAWSLSWILFASPANEKTQTLSKEYSTSPENNNTKSVLMSTFYTCPPMFLDDLFCIWISKKQKK